MGGGGERGTAEPAINDNFSEQSENCGMELQLLKKKKKDSQRKNTADAEMKTHSAETPSSKVSPLKSGTGQNATLHHLRFPLLSLEQVRMREFLCFVSWEAPLLFSFLLPG